MAAGGAFKTMLHGASVVTVTSSSLVATTAASAVVMTLPGAAVLVCLWTLLTISSQCEKPARKVVFTDSPRVARSPTGLPRSPSRIPPDGAWWPEVQFGEHGEPRFIPAKCSEPLRLDALAPLPDFQGNGKELLIRLKDIAQACQQVGLGASKVVGDLTIQQILKQVQPARSVWSAQVAANPVLFIAAEVLLVTPAPVEAVTWAIYSAQERMQWDSASFTKYEALSPGRVQAASGALGDFMYCRIPLVPGVKDRDLVQERFLLHVSEDDSYAIVLHSCTEEQEDSLRRPPSRAAVRAKTILSGYWLRAAPGGVLLTMLSQTDFGANVPMWMQGIMKKAGKRKPLEWAARLEAYCNKRSGVSSSDRPSGLMRRLTSKFGSSTQERG